MKNLRIKILPLFAMLVIIYLIFMNNIYNMDILYNIALITILIGSSLNFLVCYFNNWQMPIHIPKLLIKLIPKMKLPNHFIYYNHNKKIKFGDLGDNYILIMPKPCHVFAFSIGDIFIFIGFIILPFSLL